MASRPDWLWSFTEMLGFLFGPAGYVLHHQLNGNVQLCIYILISERAKKSFLRKSGVMVMLWYYHDILMYSILLYKYSKMFLPYFRVLRMAVLFPHYT